MRNTSTLSQHTVLKLREVIQFYNLPRGSVNNLILDTKAGVKVQCVQARLDFIKKAKSKELCTPEIRSMARRLVKHGGPNRVKA